MFVLTLFFILFFRDPDRKIGDGVVACADGRIREIAKHKDSEGKEWIKVSTFMNVYNVHVNRMPIDGRISEVKHLEGSYLPAFKKKSERNERVILKFGTAIGRIKVVLIAGALARRIKTFFREGEHIKKGDRISIIKFGSRVDLYIPSSGIEYLKVKEGDRIKAGEDTIAEIND